MNAITTDALTRYYGPRRGVEALDLEVREGEIFGFLGPNGAGKTTTIRLLLGLIRPTRGGARVAGRDIVTESRAVRERVGFLTGDVALYPQLRVEEYLRFLGRFSRDFDARRMRAYAERLDLETSQPIKGLSKGNRQKVGLVAALQHDPAVLLLDEPTSGLDPLLQQEMHRILREEKARGATVFLSSHDLAEVQVLCDRAGILREGHLVQIADVARLRDLRDRRYRVTFQDGRVPPEAPAGALVERRDSATVTYRTAGRVAAFLEAILAAHPVDLREEEVSLEDIFLRLYGPDRVQR